jgi:hypothetical protein
LKKILSLCDYTGTWGGQYEDEYEVIYVDLQHGKDIRLLEYQEGVEGIICQPPCDHFAVSGARWWKSKGETALIEGLQLVDACMRIVLSHRPRWWVLENPVGRLRHYIGPPAHTYNPCDYGDPYTKRTCLWGEFTMPQKNPVEPTEGSKMHLIPPGPEQKNIRSATPLGFAKAFRLANP